MLAPEIESPGTYPSGNLEGLALYTTGVLIWSGGPGAQELHFLESIETAQCQITYHSVLDPATAFCGFIVHTPGATAPCYILSTPRNRSFHRILVCISAYFGAHYAMG